MLSVRCRDVEVRRSRSVKPVEGAFMPRCGGERAVGGRSSHHHEERLVAIGDEAVVEETQGLLSQDVGKVVRLGLGVVLCCTIDGQVVVVIDGVAD